MANKRLGQYFTDAAVAGLLASFIENCGTDCFAIDPMAGRGDLIAALKARGLRDDNLFGIDIDAEACAAFARALPDAHVWQGDGFSNGAVEVYRSHDWDIVVANPPYVRREALAELYGREDACEYVRKELLAALKELGVSENFSYAAKSYSAMADLTIPALILCAALVKDGGSLALVVPDSLFTRKYAAPFFQLLRDEFCVDYLVCDESRTWFDEAQVKTCLLVASRRPARSKYLRIGLTDSLRDANSLVGRLEFNGLCGDEAFQLLIRSESDYRTSGLSVRLLDTAKLITPSSLAARASDSLSRLARDAYSVDDWGVDVYQGLRTGANDFFYFQSSGDGMFSNGLYSAAGLGELPDNALLRPTLRYQADVSSLELADGSTLPNRLLVIDRPLGRFELSDDAQEGLLRYVRFYERVPVKSKGKDKLIPTMSAVRPNGPTSDCESARYWYMLPSLRKRHLPNLAMARVVGGVPNALLLPAADKVIVDANFNTIVLGDSCQISVLALFALLNSLPIAVQLEMGCTVMGGGALKVEARDIKRLALPAPNEVLLAQLEALGAELRGLTNYTYETSFGRRLTKVVCSGYPSIAEHDGDYGKQLLDEYLTHRALRSQR